MTWPRVARSESAAMASSHASIRPVKGTAVWFSHRLEHGEPDPLAWHAVCFPLSEVRWTAQLFKAQGC